MTSKVKVSEFIASSARYAKKAATAAANASGRIGKAEAKALPKDLQDDFKRMTRGGKKDVSAAQFAKDQAAYVAAQAKKADADKDGILSATEAKKLPASLKDNYANFAANHVTPSNGGGAVSSFTTKGKGTPDTLGGASFSKLSVASGPKALAASLSTTSGGTPAYVAAWKGAPTDVAAMLANPSAHQDFFNDVLFHGTGTSYEKDYPSYYTPAGLTVSPLTSASAASALADGFLGNGSGTAAQVKDQAAKLTAQLDGPGVKLFHLSWTNHDDASFDGIVAFNPSTGEIRETGFYSEP
jgi:hypothetical protein